MERGKKRMAVLVGCNYLNTQNELQGCINDVHAMWKLITQKFRFHPSHVQVLTDEPGSRVKPTGVNIKGAINRMIDLAEPGDVLFFHYSGHGTRIPSRHHLGQEEAIVPCDFNLLTGDMSSKHVVHVEEFKNCIGFCEVYVDFRQLVNRLPKQVSFTIISDSCHSGGLIDKEKEQIGPSSTPLTSILHHHIGHHHRAYTAKSIPYESILQQLATLTSIVAPDIGTHLTAYFGEDASPRFRLSHHELNMFERLHPDSGILLSGCQANETSADMPGSGDGKAYGAFSHAIQTVFKEYSGPLDNREVVMLARRILRDHGIDQHPCLYCSDENTKADFLWQCADQY
ncbi:Metacaspase-9-like protein [Drosera capensis]